MAISTGSRRSDPDLSGSFQQTAMGDAASLKIGQLGDPSNKFKTTVASSGGLVDSAEQVHILTKVQAGFQKEVIATSALQPRPNQSTGSLPRRDPIALSSKTNTSTRLPAQPQYLPSQLTTHMRGNTMLFFFSTSNEVIRTRRLGTCDTAGKLFLQADAGGLVRRSDEEAALRVTIPGNNQHFIIPNKDEESFSELVNAIVRVQRRRRGNENSSCIVEVRRYG